METRIYEKASSVQNSTMSKLMTKKRLRQNAVGSLLISLVFALGAGGFAYWDYREQVKSYNLWERGSGLDLKTGKPIPNYQPPPFKYRYEKMAFLPYIIIFSAVSLLMMFLAISEFQKSAKMVETPEMLAADAEREKIENSPEFKRAGRIDLFLRLLPYVVLIPVPFIAMYGLGAVVFGVYIGFAAIAIGAGYYFAGRWKSKRS